MVTDASILEQWFKPGQTYFWNLKQFNCFIMRFCADEIIWDEGNSMNKSSKVNKKHETLIPHAGNTWDGNKVCSQVYSYRGVIRLWWRRQSQNGEDLYPIAMVFRTGGALLLSTSIWNIKNEEMKGERFLLFFVMWCFNLNLCSQTLAAQTITKL